MDLTRLSAAEQLDALNRGRVSSRELTTAHLDRIERHPEYNAVVTVDAEGALAAAKEADRQRARGRGGTLLGLPVTLKDSLETAGLRTTCGTADLARHVPDRDADAVPDQTGVPVPERHITVDGRRRGYWDQTTWLNLAGVAGLPAATVPLGESPEGLPLSVQLIGPHLADRTVTHLAGLLGRG